MTLKTLWAAVASSALAICASAQAQAPYPAQPIKLVVAAAAGGEADAIARAVADGLQARLGVAVVVDNRPGAGVSVGSGFVARSAPDGYTLLLAGSGLTASPAVMKAALDPVKDFTPVSQILSMEFYLLARSSVPAKSVSELVALSKTQPINYGSAGLGSITYLQMEMLKAMSKLEATHIPYKGTSPGLNSLVAGDIQVMFAGAAAVPFIQSGALRPLAVAMPKRSSKFPQVPALTEQFSDYNGIAWIGLVGPPGLPPAIVTRLNSAVASVVIDPAFVSRMEALGGVPAGSSPEAMGDRLRNETSRYLSLARSLGIKPE